MLNLRLPRDAGTFRPGGKEILDLVIIGAGPAGLAAGLYAARAGLDTLLLEKDTTGGQAAATARVENCPGCVEGSGAELAQHMLDQGVRFGLKTFTTEVTGFDLRANPKTLETTHGEILTKTLIVATGAQPARLGAKGEERFVGKGLMYCATCDGPFYKDKHIAVIGGGDSATQEGHYLTRFTSKVTIVHRRDRFRADKILQDRVFSNPKIEIIWNAVVEEVRGKRKVESLLLRNTRNQEPLDLPVDGVFVYIGLKPNTSLFKGHLPMDERGYLITDERMETGVPGVFAAGDARQKTLRQVVTATADGALAAVAADEYIHGG